MNENAEKIQTKIQIQLKKNIVMMSKIAYADIISNKFQSNKSVKTNQSIISISSTFKKKRHTKLKSMKKIQKLAQTRIGSYSKRDKESVNFTQRD